MELFENIPTETLRGIRFVLADIDDTISTRGKLSHAALRAMWQLREANIRLIPVTGRPAGWCDHIARFWPVNAVVGENGGFYFHYDGEALHRRFIHDEATRQGWRRDLDKIREEILKEVAGTAVASDQPYRACDLAIDYCEDVPELPQSDALRVKKIFERHGAQAKVSSIHVNGWFGDFDKLSTTRLCMQDLFQIDIGTENDSYLFCGDSPNDQPMFEFFENSVGVANLKRFEEQLRIKPNWITRNESGEGFAEIVDGIVSARS